MKTAYEYNEYDNWYTDATLTWIFGLLLLG